MYKFLVFVEGSFMKKFMVLSVFFVAGQCAQASQNNQVSVLDTLAGVSWLVATYAGTSWFHKNVIACVPGDGFDRGSSVDAAFSTISGMSAAGIVAANMFDRNEAARTCERVLLLSMLGHTVIKSLKIQKVSALELDLRRQAAAQQE